MNYLKRQTKKAILPDGLPKEAYVVNQLQVIEQHGQRVLTTAQIADAFETDVDRIQVNFNRNRERFIEGKHFVYLESAALREFKTAYQIDNQLKHVRSLYLWTEQGAWLHAKSLNTNKAWEAYSYLVDTYYDRVTDAPKPLDERSVRTELLKSALDHEERLSTLEQRIATVENDVTLSYGEQRALQKAISRRVYELQSDAESRPEYFRQIHREIRDRWGVASYRDVKRVELEEVLTYIKAWKPKLQLVG